jgi:hypothetical protein
VFLRTLGRAVDYAPVGAVDYGPFGPVDYAAAAAVDYDAAHLWIMHLSVLWISRFAGRAELARYTLRVPNEPGATLASLAYPRL